MKIDGDKILNAIVGKLQINSEKLSAAIKRFRNILLLLIIAIASLYMIKYEPTRVYGIILLVLSFAWLYSYIVKRRGTPKK